MLPQTIVSLCNGVYFYLFSLPLGKAGQTQPDISESSVKGVSSSEDEKTAVSSSTHEASSNSQRQSKPIRPSDLLQSYMQRPDHFTPPAGNLRRTHSLAPPPPEQDELCTDTPPAPLPEPQGQLKAFLDLLHSHTESDHTQLSRGEASFAVPDDVAEDYHNWSEYRAQSVRQALCFAWANYKKRAWGADEIRPVSGDRTDRWGGMGMTIIDAVDTLLLMGLKKEEKEAREVVKRVSFDSNQRTSMFETTIRVLGGLLTAYQYTNDKVYLEKANDVGDRMLPAFNTPSGYPMVLTPHVPHV